MKYETPELTTLMPAINGIQVTTAPQKPGINLDSPGASNDGGTGYADWED